MGVEDECGCCKPDSDAALPSHRLLLAPPPPHPPLFSSSLPDFSPVSTALLLAVTSFLLLLLIIWSVGFLISEFLLISFSGCIYRYYLPPTHPDIPVCCFSWCPLPYRHVTASCLKIAGTLNAGFAFSSISFFTAVCHLSVLFFALAVSFLSRIILSFLTQCNWKCESSSMRDTIIFFFNLVHVLPEG